MQLSVGRLCSNLQGCVHISESLSGAASEYGEHWSDKYSGELLTVDEVAAAAGWLDFEDVLAVE